VPKNADNLADIEKTPNAVAKGKKGKKGGKDKVESGKTSPGAATPAAASPAPTPDLVKEDRA
jgi:hypothetical protein